ncbi:hypothetical protein F4813DRAFT_390265 [Daldinia decipiens]|uniref:uncharacterized protein n=1 Tax=Daldinia decipiens TaxID=326647 RepID=UPI0020C4BFAB|nr:uncharacterized protein F4813DRAFT_390265 [Daldinia decipiens]KAI1656924.1 hypothetical protein F4813DRAFT_390265 [Daldinia decipiens]
MGDDHDPDYFYREKPRRLFNLPPDTLPPEPILPSTWFELPRGWSHWYPAIVQCPAVPIPSRWTACNDYGREDNQLMICDLVGIERTFPYPFRKYTTEQIMKMPDGILSAVITNWHRSPGPSVTQVEADMMWFIQGLDGLRDHVPKVHKVFRDLRTKHIFIIMDYIEGSNLYKIWPHLSTSRQHSISTQIASLIKLMQKITSPHPGPLGLGRPKVFIHSRLTPVFDLDRRQYEAYIRLLIDIVNATRGPLVVPLSRLAVNELVLGNMQLDPGSFIRDKKGELWIVGWDKSGFYAPEAEMALCIYIMPNRFQPIISILSRDWEDKRDDITALVEVAKYIDRGP